MLKIMKMFEINKRLEMFKMYKFPHIMCLISNEATIHTVVQFCATSLGN